jgi:hypothetical protein
MKRISTALLDDRDNSANNLDEAYLTINYNSMGSNIMKRIVFLLVLISSLGFAQEPEKKDMPDGAHKHDGFYLSLSGGPAIGTVTMDATNFIIKKQELGGAGLEYDFKIGFVISEKQRLCLSFDLISRTIFKPSIKIDGKSVTANAGVEYGDLIYGIGITKYFMPENIFLNGTIGFGQHSISINMGVPTMSKVGFGCQLKAGKEWWISDNWGLGVAIGGAYVAADDKTDPSYPQYSGKISTTKFFFLLNATFN